MQHVHIDADMNFEEVKEFTMSLIYDGFQQISVKHCDNKWTITGMKPLRDQGVIIPGAPE